MGSDGRGKAPNARLAITRVDIPAEVILCRFVSLLFLSILIVCLRYATTALDPFSQTRSAHRASGFHRRFDVQTAGAMLAKACRGRVQNNVLQGKRFDAGLQVPRRIGENSADYFRDGSLLRSQARSSAV